MKNLFIVAALAIALAGCQREQAGTGASGGGNLITSINALTPGQQTRLSVDFSTPEDGFDELVWAPGDRITFFEIDEYYIFTGNKTTFTLTSGAGTKEGSFSGGALAANGSYLAVAGNSDGLTLNEGSLNVSLNYIAPDPGREHFITCPFTAPASAGDPAVIDFSAGSGNMISVIEIPFDLLEGIEEYNANSVIVTSSARDNFITEFSLNAMGDMEEATKFIGTAGQSFEVPAGVGSTTARIPVLWNPDVESAEFIVKVLTDENMGWRAPFSYPFGKRMEPGVTYAKADPIVAEDLVPMTIATDATQVNSGAWTGASQSSWGSAYTVVNVWDGNESTIWGASATYAFPQWIIIDMQSPQDLIQIYLSRRSGSEADTRGVEVYASTELGDVTSLATLATTGDFYKIAEFEFGGQNMPPNNFIATLPKITTTRYIRVTIVSGNRGNQANLAEFRAWVF